MKSPVNNDPTYVKLLQLLKDNCYGEPVQLAWGEAEDVLQVIWPTIVDLLAEIQEYGHALDHVIDPHDGPTCPDCQALAQSALDGVNRDGFKDLVNDDVE